MHLLDSNEPNTCASALDATIADKSATAGVVELGYVGLSLVMAVARASFKTLGFDVDAAKIAILNEGKSYIDAVRNDQIGEYIRANRFRATAEFS
jgi:UDP-N-acetyl-D-glucosamine dehydrogenase